MNKMTVIIVTLMAASCSLVDLAPFDYNSYPETRNQRIPADAQLWVEFPQTINKAEAEIAVEIRSHAGILECDYSWAGSRLIISPRRHWIRGFRYTMTIEGIFNLSNGRIFDIRRVYPFFIESPGRPPVLQSNLPADEAIVSTAERIILSFTKAMDEDQFREDFTIIPNTQIEFEWTNDGMTVEITPIEGWNPLTRHTLRLPNTVTDVQGVPLAEEYSFHFRTLRDTSPPVLVEALPWRISTGQPLTGLGLDIIDNNTGIYLLFDNPLNWDKWAAGWSIEPPMKFQTIHVTEKAIALVPEEKWIPEETYTLSLADTIEDAAGNRLAGQADIAFTSAIIQQRIISIAHSTSDLTDSLPQGGYIPLTLEAGPDNAHGFTLTLNQPISLDMLPKFISTISINAVFPSTLPSPLLTSASLITAKTLYLHYKNFTPATTGTMIDNFYRLTQIANQDKTINSAGAYVTENLEIIYVIEASP